MHYFLQVLAKSCKMVPVMIMGTLIGGKFYSSLEYFCAGLIAAGISLFAQQSSKQVVRKLEAPNAPLGYTFCFLNLVLDGYTNAKQVQGFCRELAFHATQACENTINSSTMPYTYGAILSWQKFICREGISGKPWIKAPLVWDPRCSSCMGS